MLAFWLALLYVTLEGPHQVRLYGLKVKINIDVYKKKIDARTM